MENREDILNKLAGSIANYVKGIGTEPCELKFYRLYGKMCRI